MKHLLIILLLICHYGSSNAQKPLRDSVLYYHIKVLPGDNKTDVEVSLRFRVQSDTAVNIRLPQDMYGVSALYRYVKNLTGENGSSVDSGRTIAHRRVTPNQQREVHVRYLLSYDQKSLSDYTYGPFVSPSDFQLAFCQWILLTGQSTDEYYYDVSMEKPSAKWNLYNSVSVDTYHFSKRASYSDMGTAVIGGSLSSFTTFYVKGKPVHIVMPDVFDIPKKQIINAVKKIVTSQRNWLSDFDFPFFYVALNNKEDNIAGVCDSTIFRCFLKKDVPESSLQWLLSHEMFHVWMGNKIYLTSARRLPIDPFQWFHEGVNDFYARLLLKETNLINTSQFIDFFNKDIINMADNRFSNYSLQKLCNLADSGKFNQEASKLAYYKGALMALRWQETLKGNGKQKTMKDFMLYIFQQVQKTNRPLTEESLFASGELFGLDIKSDYEKYIVNGNRIDVPQSLFSDTYTLEDKMIPAFNRGFSVNKGIVNITDTEHNAYKAGLRTGMEYIGGENANRFGNAWNPETPMVIIVKENGAERRISYMPFTSSRPLQLYKAVVKK
jgi:predicted metalloprotease with PDZ domain